MHIVYDVYRWLHTRQRLNFSDRSWLRALQSSNTGSYSCNTSKTTPFPGLQGPFCQYSRSRRPLKYLVRARFSDTIYLIATGFDIKSCRRPLWITLEILISVNTEFTKYSVPETRLVSPPPIPIQVAVARRRLEFAPVPLWRLDEPQPHSPLGRYFRFVGQPQPQPQVCSFCGE